MKQYKVIKDLINAPVGTILSNWHQNNSYLFGNYNETTLPLLNKDNIESAIAQKFLEPYTPEPKNWRAKNGSNFYTVDEFSEVVQRVDYRELYSNTIYNAGNYYRTEATAELVAKARKLELEWLHDKDAGTMMDGLASNSKTIILCQAMDEAREAVLRDDK